MNHPSAISGHITAADYTTERANVVKTTPLHLTLSRSLSAVTDNDAGCEYVNPASRKNRCGGDTAHIFALGGEEEEKKKHSCTA